MKTKKEIIHFLKMYFELHGSSLTIDGFYMEFIEFLISGDGGLEDNMTIQEIINYVASLEE